jgi:hypothetical protein
VSLDLAWEKPVLIESYLFFFYNFLISRPLRLTHLVKH